MSEPQIPAPLDYGHADSPRRGVRRWVGYGALAIVLVLLVMILATPSRSRSREAAYRAICASHLHQLGLAIQLYRQDHGVQYPATLAAAVAAGGLSSWTVVCPASGDVAADLPPTWPTTRQVTTALAVPGHESYLYRGAGWTDPTVPTDAVLAYEPVADHGDGANFLLADCSVAFVPMPRAARLIAAAAATTRPVSAASVP
jgi:prepilin-type processing-associated H-X9-DG protein